MRRIVTNASARLGRHWVRGKLRWLSIAGLAALVGGLLPALTAAPAQAANCVDASNPIVCENALPGDPMSDWYSANAYGEIEGFTDQISYQIGDTVNFKVQSPVPYTITILRLGWYGGDGARIMDGSPTQTFARSANLHASARQARATLTAVTGQLRIRGPYRRTRCRGYTSRLLTRPTMTAR